MSDREDQLARAEAMEAECDSMFSRKMDELYDGFRELSAKAKDSASYEQANAALVHASNIQTMRHKLADIRATQLRAEAERHERRTDPDIDDDPPNVDDLPDLEDDDL